MQERGGGRQFIVICQHLDPSTIVLFHFHFHFHYYTLKAPSSSSLVSSGVTSRSVALKEMLLVVTSDPNKSTKFCRRNSYN